MSDDSVRAALRSDVPLVVVEAPAGCGKTYQGAEYARHAMLSDTKRPLILTHTHAACSVFARQTNDAGHRVEIRTIDSVIANIAGAYHAGLGLPADVAMWARERKDGHAELAMKVARLLKRHPMIAASLSRRHGTVILDEHQDSSGDQHAIAMALLDQGAKLRVFADPVQKIFKTEKLAGAHPPWDWSELARAAQASEELDTPHRWKLGCQDLGQWTLRARAALRENGQVDVKNGVPSSVQVVEVENLSQSRFGYQLSTRDRKRIDAFEAAATSSLLILTHYNETALSLRAFFNRRILLWEGHRRDALTTLCGAVRDGRGDPGRLAGGIVKFMDDVGKGFSPSAFGNAFCQEARDGCTKRRKGKPARIQELARLLVAEPDHRGVAKMLRRLRELREEDAAFSDIEFDCYREFFDAIRLGEFDAVDAGLTEMARRRAYARPQPPPRAISTIHKAKGLECKHVVVMPCDAQSFPDKPAARCLLYVALSRATHRLMLVISRNKPSPLFVF